jgi:hypothetical protein
MERAGRVLGLCVAAGCLLTAASIAGEYGETAPLRYRFQPRQTYVYEVRIHGELPESERTVEGHSQYVVKSVDSASGRMTLENSGSLATHEQSKPSRGFGFGPPHFPPFPGSPFAGPSYGLARKMMIAPDGAVVSYEGDAQLPFLLGNLGQLVLDPLPSNGRKNWDSHREVEITRRDVSFPPLPSFVGNRETRRPAQETVNYTLLESKDDTAVIAKKYRLATVEQAAGQPAMEQSG